MLVLDQADVKMSTESRPHLYITNNVLWYDILMN